MIYLFIKCNKNKKKNFLRSSERKKNQDRPFCIAWAFEGSNFLNIKQVKTTKEKRLKKLIKGL